MFKNMNTNEKGNVGLSSAIYWFTSKGYTVSIPLTDSQKYDLIVDMNDTLYKIQVKTTGSLSKHKSFIVPLRTKLGRKNREDLNIKYYDYLFILTKDKKKYLIPVNDLSVKTNLYLGKKYNKYIIK